MITPTDIYQWAAGIASSQGTATKEEEALAHRIRNEDARLRPLSTWACFSRGKAQTFPWMLVVNGPDGFAFHTDTPTFAALAEALVHQSDRYLAEVNAWASIEAGMNTGETIAPQTSL